MVTIGKEICHNIDLFDNQLNCKPPPSEPFDQYALDGAPRVIVSAERQTEKLKLRYPGV